MKKQALLEELEKRASIWSKLLPIIGSASPSFISSLRNVGVWAKNERAGEAWSDALREKPLRALVPGLKTEFKQLYVTSPRSADRLLDYF